MSKLMDWVMSTMGDDDDLDEIQPEKAERREKRERDIRHRPENNDYNDNSFGYSLSPRSDDTPRKSKVVNIHTTAQLKVVVVQPQTYDDSTEIVDHLKSKKPVIVNLEKLEKELARKVVDFLSGAVYALDGSMQKVSHGIILMVPYNMGIMGDFSDELKTQGLFDIF